MAIIRPTVPGGTIAVSDSEALATLDSTGLPQGSAVFNVDVGSEFVLTPSTPDDRDITLAEGDNVDAETRIWTFDNGAFFDGNVGAILTVADAASDQNNGEFTIEAVLSATEIRTMARSVPLVDETFDEEVVTANVIDLMPAPVTDEIVAVAGQTGIRWIVRPPPGAGFADAPLSGTGTELDPYTIAEATTSDPGAMSAADKTKLDALELDGWIKVGPTVGDAQDVTLFTGRSGAADGGYEFMGDLAATAGVETYYLRPNNSDSNCECRGIAITGSVAIVTGNNLLLTDAASGNTPHFRCSVTGLATVNRFFSSVGARGPQSSGGAYYMTGQIATAAGDMTSAVIHGDSADSIKEGSIFWWRPLGAK